MTPEQVQELVDALKIGEHDVIGEAVLIAQLHDAEFGGTGISLSATNGVTWISQLGMLRAAEIVTTKDLSKPGGLDG